MQRYKPSAKELKDWKQSIDDCNMIYEDLQRAKAAGVPNIEHLEDALLICKQRVEKLREIYAPGAQ